MLAMTEFDYDRYTYTKNENRKIYEFIFHPECQENIRARFKASSKLKIESFNPNDQCIFLTMSKKYNDQLNNKFKDDLEGMKEQILVDIIVIFNKHNLSILSLRPCISVLNSGKILLKL